MLRSKLISNFAILEHFEFKYFVYKCTSINHIAINKFAYISDVKHVDLVKLILNHVVGIFKRITLIIW